MVTYAWESVAEGFQVDLDDKTPVLMACTRIKK